MISQPRILLADDNPDDQTFIRDAFKYIKAKVELQIVDSGKELLHRLTIVPDDDLPSLIVLDYNMPELNGAEVLEILLKQDRFSHIPKIMLSTSIYQKHIDHCLQIGANGYLTKPDNFFEWERLAHKMIQYIKA